MVDAFLVGGIVFPARFISPSGKGGLYDHSDHKPLLTLNVIIKKQILHAIDILDSYHKLLTALTAFTS